MDVEVSGTPDPTVTWYKDNKPLKDSLISEHKIKQSGNNYTLVFESGMCIPPKIFWGG